MIADALTLAIGLTLPALALAIGRTLEARPCPPARGAWSRGLTRDHAHDTRNAQRPSARA